MPLISFQNLTFTINNKNILDNITGSISTSDRIGLIGNNGAGKTTLLNIISKKNEPTSGMVIANVTIAYVKQFELDKMSSTKTVFDYLQVFDNWWSILEQYEIIFKTSLNPETKLKDLSGGEFTKINIANAFTSFPNLILLDEPTNHLDHSSVEYLTEFLKKYSGAFLISSHDIDFLNDTVDKIWELSRGELKVYGGNYEFYKEQKAIEEENIKRNHEVAKKQMNKIKQAILKENKRSERGKNRMLKMKKTNDRSIPTIVLNAYKNRAENKGSQISEKLEKLQTRAADNLENSKSNVTKKAFIDLKTTAREGKLISIKAKDLRIADELLIKNINLDIYSKDRMAITGANGTGKTLLVKNIIDNKENFYKPELKLLYLSQKYENIDYDKTVIENMESLGIGYELIRKILGNFLFIKDVDLKEKVIDLSGGELARLSIAKLSASDIDLLILDEPTNNLDINTIGVLIEALNEFKGALIVISHNKNFLNQINIERFYKIENKKLMETDPA
ncbi:MAG: ribosomal protection-like ABC-F family protein [Candidatus Dojkabacteria bacterium]